MAWESGPLVLPLLVAAALAGILGVALLYRRPFLGAVPFAVLLLAVAAWSAAYGVELSLTQAAEMLLWAKLGLSAAALIPLAWFEFALVYSGRARWVNAGSLFLAAVIPAGTIGMVWFDAYRPLIWAAYQLSGDSPVPSLLVTYGAGFWVFTAYCYALLLAGAAVLVQTGRQSGRSFERGIAFLVACVLVPWIGNGLYIFRVGLAHILDLAPFLYGISSLVLILGYTRSWWFDLLPSARADAVEEMADGVLIVDEQGRIADINRAAARILGLKVGESAGKQAGSALARFPQLAESASNHFVRRMEMSIDDQDQVRYYEVQISPFTSAAKQSQARSIVIHDVTDRKRTELELERSHALMLSTFEATADGILVVDGKGKVARYNQKFIELWRVPEDVLQSGNEQAVVAFILDQLSNPAAFYRLMNRLSLHPDTDSFDELDLKDGRVFERYSRPQKIGDKRIGRVWSFRDITQQRQAEERLRFLSAHDILTGLYNRVYYEEELNRLEGSRQYPISIIMGDVDGLKETNDRYGHQAGDALLRKAAEILRQACRTEDVVARIGGDEFAIILPHSSVQVAENAIRRIREVNAVIPVADGQQPVSLSLGAATCEAGESLRLTTRQADKIMYQMKRGRRSQ